MIPKFRVKDLSAGIDAVVGDCNGWPAKERMELETPIFAKKIISHLPAGAEYILDYGCGIGRLAKEILKHNKTINIIGLDNSDDQLRLARQYVDNVRFTCMKPEELSQKVDMVYCIYVLQHVPAIELRHAIERMHHYLKADGKLIYCSSDFRLSINTHNKFTNDEMLGVNTRKEVERLFREEGDLFNLEEEPKIIKDIVLGIGPKESAPIAHPAKVYVRKNIPPYTQYFKLGYDI